MKLITLWAGLTFGLFLGGCAHETCYIDREFSHASNAAFDKQIINKDYKYADKDVSGMDALYSENVMGQYLETYKMGFTKEQIDISSFDLESN